MPKGVHNRNKKSTKKKRKSKEDKLQEKYEKLQKEFQELDRTSTATIRNLYGTIDSGLSKQNELRATIHNLNVVISTLGDRIYLLQK